MKRRENLKRFDLLMPPTALEVIEKEAKIKGICARTMGRILLIEKVKEIIGLAPDDILADDPVQTGHSTTTEGV